ncbi:Tripartite motif-containing protein [Trichinella spiralis]|uniref:Tripartite motif-containing protein n=1 Tax=Trichinella spiralis TaxID=6334 RepID=A0ABR3KEN7_TRISP
MSKAMNKKSSSELSNGTSKSLCARPAMQQCEICSEDHVSLKLLHCGHSYCLLCIRRWIEVAEKSDVISCPQCRQLTELCQRSVETLRTKFAGVLRCFQCFTLKDLEDMWWCHQCLNTLCSRCIIISHKDHNVNAYGEFDALHACIAWMRERCDSCEDEIVHLEQSIRFVVDQILMDIFAKARQCHQQRLSDVEQLNARFDFFHNEWKGPSLDERDSNLAGFVLSEFKAAVERFSVDQLEEAGRRLALSKSPSSGNIRMLESKDWQNRALVHQKLKRPIDLCTLPDKSLLKKCHSNVYPKTVCFSTSRQLVLAAIPEEHALVTFNEHLNTVHQLPLPQNSGWMQMRCSEAGVAFCATYDSQNFCLSLYCLLESNIWHAFAVLGVTVEQFFGFTLLPPLNDSLVCGPNLAKLLSFSDTGGLYEITVERFADTVLKYARPKQMTEFQFQNPTAVTCTSSGTMVMADGGILYELDCNFKLLKIIGSVGIGSMITAIATSGNKLYATVCNKSCVAVFFLN